MTRIDTLELAYGRSITLNYAEGRNVWIDCDYTITQEEDIVTDQETLSGIAATDTTLDPVLYTLPTYTHIREAGSENVHLTFFPNVEDKTGLYRQENDLPHEYDGHFGFLHVVY